MSGGDLFVQRHLLGGRKGGGLGGGGLSRELNPTHLLLAERLLAAHRPLCTLGDRPLPRQGRRLRPHRIDVLQPGVRPASRRGIRPGDPATA